MIPCAIKSTTGVECPGCGSQRAFVALVKGEFVESFAYFPPLIPILLMLLILVIHLVKPLKHGARILVYLCAANVLFVLVNYVFKIWL